MGSPDTSTNPHSLPPVNSKKFSRQLREPSRIRPATSTFLDKKYAPSNGLCFQTLAEAAVPMSALQWRPPRNDKTIPQTDEEHRAVTRQLVTAFKDMSSAKDTMGNAYRKRLTPGSTEYYSDWAIEACAWDVLVSL